MKTIHHLSKACILAVFMVIFCSCNGQKYHTTTIVIADTCSLEQQAAAYEVINKRISSIWKIKDKSDLIDGR